MGTLDEGAGQGTLEQLDVISVRVEDIRREAARVGTDRDLHRTR